MVAVQRVDRGCDPRAPLASQKAMLGIGSGPGRRDARFVRARDLALDEPPIAPAARLAAIEASVDENAREPDLERPGFAIGRDVREDLDKRVLDGLVGLIRVAQILIGDASGAA